MNYFKLDNRMNIREYYDLAVKASKQPYQYPLRYITSSLRTYLIYHLMQNKHSDTDFLRRC